MSDFQGTTDILNTLGATTAVKSRSKHSKQTDNSGRLEATVTALRERIRSLESENRRLYEQCFILHEQLANTNVHERERIQFVSGLAHELRNPLTSIKGYLDLLLDGAGGDLNDLQQEFLSTAGANANRLNQIINELLDISKFERGLVAFNPALIDLRAVVEQAVADSRFLFEAREIEFTVNLPPQTAKLEVNADKERLLQAIRAILANTGRHCSKGDAVSLDLYWELPAQQVLITISDSGEAIPMSDLPKIFTKFWQSDDPAWREKGLFGIGLAIAKAVVEMHNGNLEAANRPEGGNVFTLSMPLVNYQALLSGESDIQPKRAALVVSSDPTFCEMAEKLLGEGGFQVVTAGQPEEVLSSSLAWQPDLIIQPEGATSSSVPSVPTLELALTGLEQRAIIQGALAVLPFPATEHPTLDSVLQAILSQVSPEDVEHFKLTQPILLVSPINETLRNLDKLLRDNGFGKVYRATMEYDALTLARRHHPTVLMVDVTIAGGQADISLLENLREDKLLQHTNTIVFAPAKYISASNAPTYHPESSNIRKLNIKLSSENQTNINFVPKPFIKNVFLSLIKRLVAGKA